MKPIKILPDLMAPAAPVKKVINTPVPKFKLRAAIQGELMCLRDDSVFAEGVRTGAVKHLDSCLKMILSQAKDNRKLVAEIVGDDLLKKIEGL